MQKLLTLTAAVALMAVFSIGQALADNPKPHEGGDLLNSDIKDTAVQATVDHFTAEAVGDGPNAGINATGKVAFHGFGTKAKIAGNKATKATKDFLLTTSVSWDWGPYNIDHRCALVNTSEKTDVFAFVDTNDDGVPDDTGSATWAATIDLKNVTVDDDDEDDIIHAIVRGGSVCEIAYVFDDVGECDLVVRIGEDGFENPGSVGTVEGTINEFITNFRVVGGEEISEDGGDYSTAHGEGFLRLIFNSCTGEAEVNQIFLKVDFDDFVGE